MKGMFRVEIQDTLSMGLKTYFKKAGINPLISTGADRKAKIKVGLQLINFIINGSSNEAVTPPVKWGNLRACGSVFVGSEFVGGNNLYPRSYNPGNEQPCTSYSDNSNTITVGFNASYTARMHETVWEPGPVSEQSRNVGNKFVEKHLKADKETLIKMYADTFRQETGG